MPLAAPRAEGLVGAETTRLASAWVAQSERRGLAPARWLQGVTWLCFLCTGSSCEGPLSRLGADVQSSQGHGVMVVPVNGSFWTT